MSKLSWGKPTVEIGVSTAGNQATAWTCLAGPSAMSPTHIIVEDSSHLTTSKGNKQEAFGEGRELVDARYDKSSYTFEFELFQRKGDQKPTLLVDTDGVITGNFSLRLTPEDTTCPGFVLDCCSASVEETWSSKDGQKWKYTFDALLPATGTILKPYVKAFTVSPSSVVIAEGGGSADVTCINPAGTISVQSKSGPGATKITTSVSGDVVTITASSSWDSTDSPVVVISDSSTTREVQVTCG